MGSPFADATLPPDRIRKHRPVPAGLRFLCAPVIALLVLSASNLPAQSYRQGDRSLDNSQRQVIPSQLPDWATSANDEGPADATKPLPPLTLVLRRPAQQESAFERLLADQQNPASPDYHRWLTPSQVGERFGAPAKDIARVTGWLQANNLHVDWVSPSRIFIGFSGSVADLGRAFQTGIHLYRVAGVQRFAESSQPSIPSALADIIQNVRGLYEVNERPMHRFKSVSAVSPKLTDQTQHFITPQDFATIYDIALGSSVNNQTIGIVGESRTDSGDFTNFVELTGTYVKIPTEVIPTAYGGVDPGPPFTSPPASNVSVAAQAEATLDVLRAGSTASAANILLVVATPSSGGIAADAQYLVQTSPVPAPVMSISFGECESLAGAPEVEFWDSLFQQAASEGISVFVSSGDAGASGCDTNFATPPANPKPNSPNALCSSSYATCVGGTEFNDRSDPSLYWSATNGESLNSALSYIPEGAWNEPLNSNAKTQAASSGGGVSSVIATPGWQTGAGVPTARSGRYTPDVAFSSADHDGYFACFAAGKGSCISSAGQFSFAVFSGTSAAAPSMAGVAALLNDERGVAQGNLNPGLYALAANMPAAFHDVTVSTSGVNGCGLSTPSMCNNSIPGPTALTGGQPGYLVTAGFDQVTGLGSLDVQTFLNTFAGPKDTPTLTLTTTPSITTAQPEVVGVVVSGTGSSIPSGTVVLTCATYTANATTSNGQAQFTIPAGALPVGNDTLTASFTPDTPTAVNYNPATGTTPITVTASPLITPTLYLAPTQASVVTAQSLQIYVSVDFPANDAVPTGSISLSGGTFQKTVSGAFSNTLLITLPPESLPPGTDTITATYTPDSGSSGIYTSATASLTVTLTIGPLITPSVSADLPSSGITSAQPLPLDVIVDPGYLYYGYLTPTGTVTVTSGSYASAVTSLSNGTANIVIPAGALALGNDVLTFNYLPDAVSAAVYTSATANATIAVIPAPAPSFTVSGTPVSLLPGATGNNTSTLTITPSGGFTGTIDLSCSITPKATNDPPTCSIPASLAITGTAAQTATLTVNTTAPTTAMQRSKSLFWPSPSGAALAIVLLFGIPLRRKKWHYTLALLALLAALSAGVVACGGGGSGSGGGGGTSNPGTTAGNYTITITAASGAITETSMVNLTVE